LSVNWLNNNEDAINNIHNINNNKNKLHFTSISRGFVFCQQNFAYIRTMNMMAKVKAMRTIPKC